MDKFEFLYALQQKLAGLPEEDVSRSLDYYAEMIDDRIEEGLSEQDAVAQIGDVNEIIASILAEIPQRAPEQMPAKIAEPAQEKEAPKKKSKKGMEPWQIVLLILGAPLWVPLLIAAFSIVIALIAVLWSVVGTLWGALFGTLAGCGIGVTLLGLGCMIAGKWVVGTALFGAGLACIGLAVFAFFACVYTTKGAAWLTKMTFVGIAKLFTGRRDV